MVLFGTRRSCRASALSVIAISLRLLVVALFLSALPGGQGAAQAQTVDWLLNYEDANDPVAAGATVDYPATVTNNGTAAPATFIELTVPNLTTMTGFLTPGAGLAIDNCRVVAAGATAPFAGGTALPAVTGERVICDIPPLDFLETAEFTPQFLTSAPATPPQSYQLTMTVLDEAGVDLSQTNNSLTETTTVRAGADLGIILDLPATAASGSRVPFTIDVENFGPNDSDGYSFTFSVPPGLVDVTLPAGCTQAGSTVTCTIGATLAASASTTFTFDALVVAAGGSDVSVSANVVGTTPDDPVGSNNSTSDQMLITGGTDVSVTISRDTGAEVLSNTPVEFTLSPEYSGDAPETVTITHTIPPEFTFVPGDIVAPGWTVGVAGNDLTFTRTLGAGATAGEGISLGDIIIPTTAVTPADDVVSTVNITSTGPVDQNPGNNTDSIETTILQPEVDLVADKSGPDPALGVVGLDYDFTLSASNQGNTAFDGTLVVRDVIPDTLAFSAASGPGWVCVLLPGAPPAGASGVVECTRDYTPGAPLEAGETAPPITVTLTATAEGVRDNRMEITTINPNLPDANPANNIDDFEFGTAVGGNSADISVAKGVALDPLDAGELQTYTLELINNDATQTALDVTLTDAFSSLINNSATAAVPGFEGFTIDDPSGIATNLTCSSASSGGRGRVLTCEADALAPCTAGGDCPVITVQVRHGTNATTIGNTADIISALTPDPDLGNNESSTSFTQNRLAEITVDKTVSAPTIEAGQNVIFVVTGQVENTGQSNANDFTITDTLPAGMRFISAVSPQGACANVPAEGDIIVAGVNDELVCTYGSVSNGQQRSLTVTMQPTNDQIGQTLTNSAEVSTTTTEEGTLPNTATAETVVTNPITDIQINKDDSVDPLPIGSNTVYQIEVTNGGPSTSEDIVVTDTLPQAGLRFVGATIAAPGVCDVTGVDADGIGGEVVCTWPVLLEDESFEIFVEMEGIAAGDFPNSVEVSSFEILNNFDADTLNNTNTENTTVRADLGTSSIAGTFFRDFDNEGTQNLAADTGIEGTTITLNGVGPGGLTLTRTVDTDASGDFLFEDLPGDGWTYTVTRGDPSDPLFTDGIDTPGSEGGTAVAPDAIEGIQVPNGVDATDYDFAITPSPTIGLSKDLGAFTVAGDSSYTATFNLEVENLSSEPLLNIAVTDPLTGAAPLFGTLATPAVPATDVLAPGTYAIVSTGAGSCGGFNTGFNGDGDQTIASGFSLPVGGTCTISFTIRVQPTDPAPTPQASGAQYLNQATVNGEGELTGLPVTDLSDDGTVIDGDDNRLANETGENDPTPITLDPQPSIELLKEADTSALSTPPAIGDIITYNFTVRNTGNVPLTDVTVTDPLPGLVFSGAPIPTLAIGGEDTDTFVGTYALTADDLTNGAVVNTASVTGDPPAGPPVTDDDTETVPLGAEPGITLDKIITDQSDLEDGAQVGDQIFYAFTITNTGNVPLRDVTVTDPLPGIVLSGAPIALMNPASAGDGTDVDTTTYTAVYTLDAADVAAGGRIENTATVTGTVGPLATPLTVDDDDTVVASPPSPADGLTLTKVTPDDVIQRGTIAPYIIRLRNDLAFTVTDIDLVDTLPEGLIFVPGSAQLDGVAFPVTVSGQTITFEDISIDPGVELVFTINARVLNSANPGVYVNSVAAFDPLFGLVAGPATASVRILPEAVFDCSDVIGRVFDDLDADGFQDAYDPTAISAAVVDPDVKIEEVASELSDEVGLSGVRLVTLDGLVITTDANGLFSVPCAALPADIGSNFLLSLDERTLPLGYEMTTQNPRVVRLTPGVLNEMNFGARLAQRMRVDLSAQAFAHGLVVSPEMQQGIAAMVARLVESPSTVELVFHVPAQAGSDAVATGRDAMAIVAAEIDRQWSGAGSGRLRIEQTIARGGN